mgnify:CR=1 FL=1
MVLGIFIHFFSFFQERLEFFTDGIFVITMCLVLVEMHVSAAAPFAPSFKKVSKNNFMHSP